MTHECVEIASFQLSSERSASGTCANNADLRRLAQSGCAVCEARSEVRRMCVVCQRRVAHGGLGRREGVPVTIGSLQARQWQRPRRSRPHSQRHSQRVRQSRRQAVHRRACPPGQRWSRRPRRSRHRRAPPPYRRWNPRRCRMALPVFRARSSVSMCGDRQHGQRSAGGRCRGVAGRTGRGTGAWVA